MTPEQRHDLIKRRKAQVKRLETKAKALKTRIAKAKRSIAGLERAQAKAGVDPAVIEAERAQAKDMAMLESFVGRPKKPRPVLPTHFVFHGDDQRYRARDPRDYGHTRPTRVRRSACGGYVALTEGRAMRKDAVVTCKACMELKAAWLAQPKQKPLTIRRAELIRGNTVMVAHGPTCDATTPAGPVEHKTTTLASLDYTSIERRILRSMFKGDKHAAFKALYGGRS